MAQRPRRLSRRQFFGATGGAAALAALNNWTLAQAQEQPVPHTLRVGAAEDVGMSSARIEDVFARVQQRVNQGLFPGAVALIARRGVIVGQRAFGVKVRNTAEQTGIDTLFDLESMTKVLATATSALILVQQGRLKPSDPVAQYLPDFAANGKEAITVHDMLRYSAGLPVDNRLPSNPDHAAVWKAMAETALEYPPGSMVEYSDLTYRLLGRVVEAAAGSDLDSFARETIWRPLGMADTMFNPPATLVDRIAATGPGSDGLRTGMIRGEVQDDQDWALGGICGCDGVFSTAGDIALFCQMFLNRGVYGDVTVLRPDVVAAMTQNQTAQVSEEATDLNPISNLLLTPKGYGWELWTNRFSSGGMRLSRPSYGKAGGAGTFMWLDPERELFAIYLTNHGLPIPFDEPGWNNLLDSINAYQFFDGVINAVVD